MPFPQWPVSIVYNAFSLYTPMHVLNVIVIYRTLLSADLEHDNLLVWSMLLLFCINYACHIFDE